MREDRCQTPSLQMVCIQEEVQKVTGDSAATGLNGSDVPIVILQLSE